MDMYYRNDPKEYSLHFHLSWCHSVGLFFLLQPVYFCLLFSDYTISGIHLVLVSIYWYPPAYMVHGSAPALHGVAGMPSSHGGLILCILVRFKVCLLLSYMCIHLFPSQLMAHLFIYLFI